MLHKLKSLSAILIKMSFFSNLVEEEGGQGFEWSRGRILSLEPLNPCTLCDHTCSIGDNPLILP